MRKRPYLTLEVCHAVVAKPLRREAQSDGRIRHWAEHVDVRDGKARIMRVVTLADGETIHNAFFDRDFVKEDR